METAKEQLFNVVLRSRTILCKKFPLLVYIIKRTMLFFSCK